VLWSGPFAAQAAAGAGLLQPYQPQQLADGALHHPQWLWTTLDTSVFSIAGEPAVSSLAELGSVPRLALADPERSESGMALLLATLDRARQVDGDPERGWAWWQQRARNGLALFEDEADARAASEPGGGASHAITRSEAGPALPGLAPIPNAAGLAKSARDPDAARKLLDWLTGEQAAASLRLSPWQAASNGLRSAFAAAPPLDVDWATQQYAAARRRWAASGFGPSLSR
jgi:ABC-type Fe3+ transport system substrate-binding protein